MYFDTAKTHLSECPVSIATLDAIRIFVQNGSNKSIQRYGIVTGFIQKRCPRKLYFEKILNLIWFWTPGTCRSVYLVRSCIGAGQLRGWNFVLMLINFLRPVRGTVKDGLKTGKFFKRPRFVASVVPSVSRWSWAEVLAFVFDILTMPWIRWQSQWWIHAPRHHDG